MEALTKIGDSLGACLGIDEDFINGKKDAKPNILVEIEEGVGIYKSLEIISEFGSWLHKVAKSDVNKLGKCLSREDIKNRSSDTVEVDNSSFNQNVNIDPLVNSDGSGSNLDIKGVGLEQPSRKSPKKIKLGDLEWKTTVILSQDMSKTEEVTLQAQKDLSTLLEHTEDLEKIISSQIGEVLSTRKNLDTTSPKSKITQRNQIEEPKDKEESGVKEDSASQNYHQVEKEGEENAQSNHESIEDWVSDEESAEEAKEGELWEERMLE